jgi:hypothetical protein
MTYRGYTATMTFDPEDHISDPWHPAPNLPAANRPAPWAQVQVAHQPAVRSRSCGSVSRRRPGKTISLLQEWPFRRQR